MISASLSLSLPRLGWKSTSMPRSLKICTAAGDSASEMSTLDLDIGVIPCGTTLLPHPRTCPAGPPFSMDARVQPGQDDVAKTYAAFPSVDFISANAQSI